MSFRDLNKVLNVQDLTTGRIIDVLKYASLDDFDGYFRLTNRDMLILKAIKRVLSEEHSVCLKIGYKE